MKYINSKKKLFLIIILAILLIGAVSFFYYVSDYYHADSIALAALTPNAGYTVNITEDSITFTPTKNQSKTSVIIYQGPRLKQSPIRS